jgi:PAS domain S-box-containing protein
VLQKNGTAIFFEAYDEYIDFRGKLCRMTAMHNITERKLTELALQKNQMLLSSIIDNSPAIIFLKDMDGRYLLVNKPFSKLFNIQPEQLIGKTELDGADPAIISNFHDTDLKVLQNKTLCEFEIALPDPEGNDRIFNVIKFPLFDNDGKIYGVGGIATDITERKKTENIVRQRDQIIRGIVETSNDWLWATDETGVFKYSNPAALEMLGFRPDELIGKSGFEFMHPDDMERGKSIYLRSCASRTGWKNVHLRWKCKEGGYRILESKSVPIIDDNAQFLGFQGSERDITDRIKAEEEKETLEQQLRQSQKIEAVGQLAGGIAHDFNNILTVILGHTELAGLTLGKEIPNKNSLRDNLKEIQQSAQRAAMLTSQLLAFSRRQVSKPQNLNINHIIMDMESMLRRLISEDITLQLSTNDGLQNIRIDPNQLQQVIMNLVINSRDAISGNGAITIETNNVELDIQFIESHSGSHMGPNARLTISDTGCGMDRETMQRIFEPFYSTKPAGQGTGLGLSMVYGIVKQAGGYITVYSEPGNGTSVKIYFPAVEIEPIEEVTEPSDPVEYSGGTETILVCEDDETVRKLTVSILESSGYAVLQAAHANQALEIARSSHKPISLLVTDLIMPGMNGQKLSIAVNKLIPSIKTLYLSGYTANTISEHGIIGPDIEFLQKPFTRNDLLQHIRRILDGE